MNKSRLLDSLLILIIFSLSFSNQFLFSFIYENLIPVRILIPLFIILSLKFLKPKNLIPKTYKEDKIFWLLIILTAIRLLSIIPAADKRDAILLNVYWITIVGFYISFKAFVNKFKFNIKRYLKTYKLSVILASLFGIIQAVYFVFWGVRRWNIWSWQYPDGFRISGLMLDSNHYAIFILSGIFISLPFIFKKIGVEKASGILVLLLLFISFILSSSRSAILAQIISFIVLFTLSVFQKQYKFLVFSLFIFLLGIFLGFALNKSIDLYAKNFVEQEYVIHPEVVGEEVPSDIYIEDIAESERLGALFIKLVPGRVRRVFDASARSHLALLKASVGLGLKNPILGVGYGNFAEGLKNSQYIEHLKVSDPRGAAKEDFPSHTKWGETLAETGFLGFFAYAALIVLIAVRLFKQRTILGISIFSAFIGFQVFSIFYHLNEEFYWVFTFLGLEYSGRNN